MLLEVLKVNSGQNSAPEVLITRAYLNPFAYFSVTLTQTKMTFFFVTALLVYASVKPLFNIVYS